MKKQKALYHYCLRLGDDALILGHRLSEMCSKAPFLEEDLALTNISLDMIGRAQALLKYAAETEGKGHDEDFLAYRRNEKDYFNHLICEQPNGDFAHVIARQLYISAFEFLFYSELSRSRNATLSGIASKAIKEVKYHLQHASDWTVRLGDGTEESRNKMQKAINDLWIYTGELFETDETDHLMVQEKAGVDTAPLKEHWLTYIQNTLTEATLIMPDKSAFMLSGSRKGIHTENLGHILTEMQYLQRAYPDAKW